MQFHLYKAVEKANSFLETESRKLPVLGRAKGRDDKGVRENSGMVSSVYDLDCGHSFTVKACQNFKNCAL